MTRRGSRAAAGLLLALLASSAGAQDIAATGSPARSGQPPPVAAAVVPPVDGLHAAAPLLSPTRNGREIYASFRDGLADPDCSRESTRGLQQHFANAPRQLASQDSDALALFGYVVDALREEDLPTEYALIPFVESGFRPGARSPSGPAGLWQFIAMTARNHDVPMRQGYDGRLSAVDSTRAAVRYLKTLHGMFAGDWRLAVMAFNAGEYRVFGALKRSGQRADNAQPSTLVGVPAITRSYVLKLHALSCVLDRADDREEWMRALDRPVTRLVPTALPDGVTSLDALAQRQGLDAARLKRLNPALAEGYVAGASRDLMVLAPVTTATPVTFLASDSRTGAGAAAAALADLVIPVADASSAPGQSGSAAPATARSHTVAKGDSAWTIARRYGVRHADLLSRNGLTRKSVLRPGTVLAIDVPAR